MDTFNIWRWWVVFAVHHIYIYTHIFRRGAGQAWDKIYWNWGLRCEDCEVCTGCSGQLLMHFRLCRRWVPFAVFADAETSSFFSTCNTQLYEPWDCLQIRGSGCCLLLWLKNKPKVHTFPRRQWQARKTSPCDIFSFPSILYHDVCSIGVLWVTSNLKEIP